jgi:dienelactone hydrolase
LLTVARVRGGTAMLVAALSYACLYFVIPSDAVLIPARGGVRGLLWPVLPVVWALVLLSGARLWDRPTERAGQRSLFATAAVLCVSATAAGWLSGTLSSRFEPAVLTRNLLLTVGVVALSAAVLEPALRWFPVAACVAVMWLVGTNGVSDAEPWAVLFLPGTAVWADDVALVVFAAGVGAYLLRAAAVDAAARSVGDVLALLSTRRAMAAVVAAVAVVSFGVLRSAEPNLEFESVATDVTRLRGDTFLVSPSERAGSSVAVDVIRSEGAATGCVLAVHGLGGSAHDADELVERLGPRGWVVYAPSMAWGDVGNLDVAANPLAQLEVEIGKLSLVRDAMADDPACGDANVYVGISFGAMVGVALVAVDDRFDAAAFVSAGATYDSAARNLGLPSPNLDALDPVRYASRVEVPVLTVNVEDDEVVNDADALNDLLAGERLLVPGRHRPTEEEAAVIAALVADFVEEPR